MTLRQLMTIVVLLALSCLAGCAKPKPFSTAQEAVEFIADALDAGDSGALAEACVGGRPGNPPFARRPEHLFMALTKLHERTPIQELLTGSRFPADASSCVLGGHGPPLNHINIEFVKKDNSWHLANIWVCR